MSARTAAGVLRFVRLGFALAVMQVIMSCSLSAPSADVATLEDTLEGLWSYTAIHPSPGERHAADGLLLFDQGRFVQQVTHQDPGAEPTMILGNEGTYEIGSGGELRLNVDHSVIVDPVKESVRVNRHTHPAARVESGGTQLTLHFGSGAVHVLQRVPGQSPAQIVALREGALALARPFFILVWGSEATGTLAYGTYAQTRGAYRFNAARWSDASANVVRTEAEKSVAGHVKGARLVLSDGREF